MAFEITPMRDDEIDVYNKICWDAFTSVPDSLALLLYPGGYTEAVQKYMRNNTIDSLSDKSTSYIFVRDINTKQVLAVACWSFQTTDLTIQEVLDKEEKARKERAEQEPIPGVDSAVMNDFRETAARLQRENLGGKAHALLKVLATHPDAQRRGAGAAALKWGLKKADELGVPAYLEASRVGRPLYAKHGFKEICELPLNARKHGYSRDGMNWCMLRDAKVLAQ
ncbi:hypothetical protein D6C86_03721 [Aureobasidium pullulans]|uniref:N-acetyltransferase domain-containing protein n=1 Tax=Aureobasidium pullulans TaxID=5580 RepID=A0A4S8YKQ6_AURPU|nr:hypothetical protein D6D25_03449 [Aureobasidium pullulans]THW79728.1 hypothetical protein D6D18_09264 [Aureobasidium pullulans]THW92701.1 hypothetical protein D6D15_02988 [Aureobasidium pullulans]THY04333.1 hypothetical protein D6D03_03749 [Aureobasidium pullulans]THY75394.1 hypothetical protein D6C94_04082 [Aureobasidium pullulans]